jgi:hypothetical protein
MYRTGCSVFVPETHRYLSHTLSLYLLPRTKPLDCPTFPRGPLCLIPRFPSVAPTRLPSMPPAKAGIASAASLGSSADDYETDPTHPVLERMVLFGGRGWTVYELPDHPQALLKMVYDSGDQVEGSICDQIPWAHNAEQDEYYAPARDDFPNNTFWQWADEEDRAELLVYNDPAELGCVDQGDGTPGACPYRQTKDRASEGDGPAVELAISGVACGRLVSLVTTEKSAVALLYDMTDITEPTLVQMFHLSPGMKDKSAGLAYNDGTMGEIDPEIAMFLDDEESPSGKAGVFIVGAHSGSISFWEFDCADQDPQSS